MARARSIHKFDPRRLEFRACDARGTRVGSSLAPPPQPLSLGYQVLAGDLRVHQPQQRTRSSGRNILCRACRLHQTREGLGIIERERISLVRTTHIRRLARAQTQHKCYLALSLCSVWVVLGQLATPGSSYKSTPLAVLMRKLEQL